MWELLAALFGGASIASKVASNKASQRLAAQRFENEQQKLKLFRESVTNERTVRAVNDYMSMDGSKEKVATELRELFLLLPELKGREQYWICSNHRPPASNWYFVELILCINRGCVPITKQFEFSISPYYIGNDASGAPRYISLSSRSLKRLADWITKKLHIYGVNINLKYKLIGGIEKFVWSTEMEEEREQELADDRNDWTNSVTDMSMELSIKLSLESAEKQKEAMEVLRTIIPYLQTPDVVNDGLKRIYLAVLLAQFGKLSMEDCCRPLCRYGIREPIRQCMGIDIGDKGEIEIYKWLETTLSNCGVKNASIVFQSGKFAHGFSWEQFATDSYEKLW